ncbi:uncharacterized protein BXZ73DRAFT_102850 [Epithele typhae]|uniref:uncharacterized protein n=1 Tax=Epithele typhae TaxID=378194 RepID=UPI002007FC67|nr:uncharacterized protein BXZ73DRAFT_102850 [Epithele typhae]KAH9926590.1 hypothetical protein BXZ73DRAFT_102850 [Epithele typhae]
MPMTPCGPMIYHMWLFDSKKFDPATDLPDWTGKVAIVTGGNYRIGYGSVGHLARGGARVYIGARSEARAKAAIVRLHAETGLTEVKVEWFHLDLSAPKTVKAVAAAVMERRAGWISSSVSRSNPSSDPLSDPLISTSSSDVSSSFIHDCFTAQHPTPPSISSSQCLSGSSSGWM